MTPHWTDGMTDAEKKVNHISPWIYGPWGTPDLGHPTAYRGLVEVEGQSSAVTYATIIGPSTDNDQYMHSYPAYIETRQGMIIMGQLKYWIDHNQWDVLFIPTHKPQNTGRN